MIKINEIWINIKVQRNWKRSFFFLFVLLFSSHIRECDRKGDKFSMNNKLLVWMWQCV